MCRLLGYLWSTNCSGLFVVQEHSLIVQSYQPREMNSGLLNADGFGVVFLQRDTDPFTYKIYSPSGMTLTFLAWGGMLSRDVCWDMSVVLRRVRWWI